MTHFVKELEQPSLNTIINEIPPKELILKRISPNEARRALYIPYLSGLIAIGYAERALGYCAAYKMPYAAEARQIRTAEADYRHHIEYETGIDGLLQLTQLADGFVRSKVEKGHLDQLYYTIRSRLLKEHGEIRREYPYIYAHIALSMIYYNAHYTRTVVSDLISRVHRHPVLHDANVNLVKMSKPLEKITECYPLTREEMIAMSVDIVQRSLDAYLFANVEFKDEIDLAPDE